VNFPEIYVDLFCGFSNEQVFAIKNALQGTMLLGLHKGIGVQYEKFQEIYPTFVNTPSASEECQGVRFIRTSYIHDGVLTAATALDAVVESKFHNANVSISDIQITRSDQTLLAEKLFQTDIPGGITGPLSFTRKGIRKTVSFAIVNFVPVENLNFSVSNATTEDPWSLQTRAVMKKELSNVTITFFTSDGEESNQSTIIFADQTSNIPSDTPFRIFYRSE
jgi:hypothetical protein